MTSPHPLSSVLRLVFCLFVGATAHIVCGSPSARADERAGDPSRRPYVVVTTSLLAAAVHDISGNAFTVETLMPAGTCPGQFDLDPGQARRIRSATVVLRHERQGFLDSRFAAAGVPAEAIVFPKSPGLWTIPDVYARYCRLIGNELVRRLPASKMLIDARLSSLEAELGRLGSALREGAAPLRGTRVLAAQFQSEFLAWLGFEVVGTFPPTDDPSPALIRTSLALAREKRAALVVGNLQSGERLPSTLASSLGMPLAILSNFPADAREGSVGALGKDNLRRLFEALGHQPRPQNP